MEGRFGHDFGQVRVHADARAARSAAAVSALAYTVGRDVVFGAGRFAPGTAPGRALLAHELAHVIQQARGGEAPAPDPSGPLEMAADRAAAEVATGPGPVPVGGAAAIGLARKDDEKNPKWWKRVLNPVYQTAREKLPPAASELLGRANDAARTFVEGHNLTDQQINGVVAAAAPVVPMVQAGLDALPSPQPAPPQPAKPAVWVGQPPLAVRLERKKQEAALSAQYEKESPGSLPPPLPRPGSEVEPFDLTDWSRFDPPPTEFEGKVRAGAPFAHPVRPVPDIDARQLTWLGQRPSDEQLKRLRFEPVGDLPPSTSAFVPGETKGEMPIRPGDLMPVREPKTHRLLGYRLRSGETVFELDRDGNMVGTRGLEAPLEKPPIDPIDIAMLGADVGPLIAKGVIGVGGKIAARTATRALRYARIGVAGATIGTADAVPVLGRGAAGATLFDAPAVVAGAESALVSAGRPATGIVRAEQEVFADSGAAAVRSAAPARVARREPQWLLPAPARVPFRPYSLPFVFRFPQPSAARATEASGIELDTDTAAPFQSAAPELRTFDESALANPTPVTVRSGTEARKGTFFHQYNAAEIGPNRLRFDYNARNGHPNWVEFEVHADSAAGRTQSKRYFTGDEGIEGQQPRNADYRHSGWDRGHLAQREVFRGDRATERAADSHATTVPMSPNLNRGPGSPWRAAETRVFDQARRYGTVKVRLEPVYDANPLRLPDGTPIPKAITRTVYGPDGAVLESMSFLNQ